MEKYNLTFITIYLVFLEIGFKVYVMDYTMLYIVFSE